MSRGLSFNPKGINKTGNKHITWTPDLILSVHIALVRYPRWVDRMQFLRERHPNIQWNERQMRKKVCEAGWGKDAKAIRQQMYEEAMELNKSLTQEALEKELAVAEDLNEQIDRIREALKAHEPASKEYAELMKTLERCQKMLTDLSGAGKTKRDAEKKEDAQLKLQIHKAKMEINDEAKDNKGLLPSKQAEGTVIISDEE